MKFTESTILIYKKLSFKISFYYKFIIFVLVVLLFNNMLVNDGYYMTLDGVTGPEFYSSNSGIYTSSVYIIYLLTFLLSPYISDLVFQKILYLFLFISLTYFPLHFFPFQVKERYKYLASILFLVNPFVLERFLAGQWGVLLGMSMLYPFFYYLVKLLQEDNTRKLKDLYKTLLALFFVGVFNMHIFVMSVLVFVFSFFFVDKKFILENKRKLLEATFAFLVLESYWLVPTLLHKNQVVENIGSVDWTAFSTHIMSGEFLSLVSVFTLYGFWGGHEPWVDQFSYVPFTNLLFILPVWTVVLYAIFKLENIRIKFFSITVLILSSIFSLGVAETIFKPINLLLFENVGFWGGFRDSQKWTAVLVLLFSVFYALGSDPLVEKFKNKYFKNFSFFILFAFPVLYTPQVLLGFDERLQPFDYPSGWYKVSEILETEKKKTGECHAVFVPTSMYYYLSPNNGLLTGNPARVFFPCEMYQSLDPEYKGINDIPEKDEKKSVVNKILKMEIPPDEKITLLKQEGIEYLIYSKDDALQDTLNHDLYNASKLENIFEDESIDLYKLR